MATRSTRRIMRVTIASALFVILAFSFLVVGEANAQTTDQVPQHQASSQAQALPTCPSNTTRIKFRRFGQFSEMILTCNTMTVKVGTPVVFVNTTQYQAFIVNNNLSILFEVFPNSPASLPTTQAGQLQVEIYGSLHPQAMLTVNVTA